MLLLRILLIAIVSFCLDLGTAALFPSHWPFPVWTLLCVLVISLRRGEMVAMTIGWVLGMVYDEINHGAVGMTALILVLAGFSPWPLRKSRDLLKRYALAALGAGNAIVSFGVILLVTTRWSNSAPPYGSLLFEALIIVTLCAIGLPLVHSLLQRFLPPSSEVGP